MADYSQYSDEELLAMAGLGASGSNPYSGYSDEQLLQMAGGQSQPSRSIESLLGSDTGRGGQTARMAIGGLSNMIPFNAGDEIIAGGSALLDMLGGNSLGDAYDQRLNEVRNYEQAFEKQAPIGSTIQELLMGVKLPVGSLANKATSFLGKVGALGAEGAGYGAASGYLGAEGDQSNRLEDALSGGLWGGGLSAGIGGAMLGAGNLVSKYSDEFADQGRALKRSSLGASQADYNKTAKELNVIGLTDDAQVETLTKKSLDKLDELGSFGKNRKPNDVIKKFAQDERALIEKIATTIDDVDDAGVSIHPEFDNAVDYIARGKVEADRVDKYLSRLADLEGGINKEGGGTLRYLQNQKIVAGYSYKAAGKAMDESDAGFWRAVYRDLQTKIEQYAPEVGPLNQQLQMYEIVRPILQKGVSTDEAKNIVKSLMGMLRTSGGTFTTPTLIGSAIGFAGGGPAAMIPGALLTAAASRRGRQSIGDFLIDYSKRPSDVDRLIPMLPKLLAAS